MPEAPPTSLQLEPTSLGRIFGWHRLPITTTWDGRATGGRAWVAFRLSSELLEIAGGALEPAPVRPIGPAAARTDRLWEYSVVELFLVTAAGYVELELGPDGRYLAYSFAAPRVRTASHEARSTGALGVGHGGGWASTARFDRDQLLKGPIRKLNAFAHLPGRATDSTSNETRLFAYHPLPGDRPDFHQPARFPTWGSS